MEGRPAVEDAPSILAALERYLLALKFFGTLRSIARGKGGELYLTDAIALPLSEGHPIHVVIHDRIRHGLGNPAGFIPVSVESGRRHSKDGCSPVLGPKDPSGEAPVGIGVGDNNAQSQWKLGRIRIGFQKGQAVE